VGRSSEWGYLIRATLADGEWHEREMLVREAMRAVPPGRAFRASELNRKRYHDGPRVRGGDDVAIEAGRRMLVTGVLQSSVRGGSIERKDEAGRTFYRDPKAHEAKVTEDEIRSLLDRTRIPDTTELLDLMERQLTFWKRAFNMLGGDKEVRAALLGGDPVEELEQMLRKHNRR
jgi:hypothetical protein